MKKTLIISIIIIFTFSVKSQEINDTTKTEDNTPMLWSNNTAKTLKRGRKEVGLFGPLKFGLKDSMELSVHPIFFFIIPNIELKKYWTSFGIFDLASKHKIVYPTLLYKVLSKEGIGGLLPATSTIPQMFKFNNSIIIGTTINEYITATVNAGVDLTISIGESNFPEIEYHLIYPRTYSFNNLFTPYFGVNLTGKLFKNVSYEYNFTAFILTNEYKGSILENKLKFQWNVSDKFAVKAGALLTYGEYPYGQDGGLFPVFDLMYGF